MSRTPLVLPLFSGRIAIFQNVEHIYELHHKLYKDLREAMWEKRLLKDMGRLMLQYTPFFRLYITYVNDYGTSVFPIMWFAPCVFAVLHLLMGCSFELSPRYPTHAQQKKVSSFWKP